MLALKIHQIKKLLTQICMQHQVQILRRGRGDCRKICYTTLNDAKRISVVVWVRLPVQS